MQKYFFFLPAIFSVTVHAANSPYCTKAVRCQAPTPADKNLCHQPDWPLNAILDGNPLDNPETCILFEIPPAGLPNIPFRFDMAYKDKLALLAKEEKLSTGCAQSIAAKLTSCAVTKDDPSKCEIKTGDMDEACAKQVLFARAAKFENDQPILSCRADASKSAIVKDNISPPIHLAGGKVTSRAQVMPVLCAQLADVRAASKDTSFEAVCPDGFDAAKCVADHTFSDEQEDDLREWAKGQRRTAAARGRPAEKIKTGFTLPTTTETTR